MNREIDEFERNHPRLKLVLLTEGLFSDGQQNYHYLMYKFTRYGRKLYYEPDSELAEYLITISDFIESCKKRRAERTTLRRKQADLIRYLAHKKKVLQAILISKNK